MKSFFIEHPQAIIAGVIGIAMLAQFIASSFKLPSILLLLLAGISVSPVGLGLFPTEILAQSEGFLFGCVSISVAIILFEGGLTLRLSELKDGTAYSVNGLIIIGSLVTWLLTTVAALLLLNVTTEIAILLGAMLVVTGPTVVGPLLRMIRPVGRVGSIAKWEGILIDPVGVMLAVLVFEAIVIGGSGNSRWVEIVLGLLRTVVAGGVIGILGAQLLVFLIKRHFVPDHLQAVVALAVMLVAFVATNLIQHEAGLFTVTLMGIWLANQKQIPIKDIQDGDDPPGKPAVPGGIDSGGPTGCGRVVDDAY
jgi:NhaP-type Na+/H+ or K+/H+ antiporter